MATEIDAEDATSDAPEETETIETPEPDEGEADLGDAGKKALDAMKARVKAAEKAAKEARADIARRDAADSLRDKPAEEQAIKAARAEGRTEATAKGNERILKADLRAAATGKLADPTDAALYINLSEFTVSDDGDTDSEALAEAIADLLERKPHLAAGAPRKFEGSGDQGAKGKAAKLGQLTDADLESMSPAEVNKARREGRFNKILGVN
jgi:hypothetical protein